MQQVRFFGLLTLVTLVVCTTPWVEARAGQTATELSQGAAHLPEHQAFPQPSAAHQALRRASRSSPVNVHRLTRAAIAQGALTLQSRADWARTAAPAPRIQSSSVPSVTDKLGRALVLRGINVGNKAPPYVPDLTDDDFARIASWGFDTVRFLILWAAIEPQDGVYDDSYFARVKPYLDMAQRHDIHVILDMHQDVYGEMFWQDGAATWACPEALVEGAHPYPQWWLAYLSKQVNACFSWFWGNQDIQDHWIEAWRRAAVALGSHPAVLGFDLFNEPWPGFNMTPRFESEQLAALYEQVIPVLQDSAPGAWVFYEPWVLRDYFVPSFLEPLPFERLAYIPHYYNIELELFGSYHGDGADTRRWVSSVQGEAAAWGVPFLLGEYGGDTTAEGIGDMLMNLNDALDEANTGGMLWFYSKSDGGYSVLMADGSEKSWILDPLVRSYPRRVAGTIVSYQWNDYRAGLELHYEHDAAIDAPTELATPARLYPNGFELALSDSGVMHATYDATREIVVIDDTGPSGARSVLLEAR